MYKEHMVITTEQHVADVAPPTKHKSNRFWKSPGIYEVKVLSLCSFRKRRLDDTFTNHNLMDIITLPKGVNMLIFLDH